VLGAFLEVFGVAAVTVVTEAPREIVGVIGVRGMISMEGERSEA
jgi:chemotaxis signal transduction protein